MKQALMCVTGTAREANEVVRALLRGGVHPRDLSMVVPAPIDADAPAYPSPGDAADGLLQGGAPLSVAGLGKFIAAGPLRDALSNAAGDAGVGGVTGALVVLGVTEREARWCTRSMGIGRVLLSVQVASQEALRRAERVLLRNTVPTLFDDPRDPSPSATTRPD